jgi:Glutamyl-tRNAGlu reductase, dimerisation domain
MSTSLIAPVVDHHPAPIRELSASGDDHDISIHREPTERTRANIESGASVRSTTQPHRSAVAIMIRVLGERTESALRRELDHFLVARSELSHADRAAIARAMSRIRNQLLHHPRSTLRAAAATDPASVHHLIDAVRSIFKLHDNPASSKSDRRRPTDRSADLVPKESTYEDF